MTTIPVFIKPQRIIRKIFIHCSASDNPSHDHVDVIKRWHMSPDPKDPSKPWSDIGYHYYIQKTGDVQLGRPLERIPTGQKGFNAGTIAICVGGLEKSKFTQAQFQSLYAMCLQINNALTSVTFHGHCEVSKKACPVFDYKKILGLNNRGEMGPE